MGLIPTKRHSSVVPPSLLSLRIPEVLCHHQVLFLLHDSLGHSEHQPKSLDLKPLIAHSSCSAVHSVLAFPLACSHPRRSSLASLLEALHQVAQSVLSPPRTCQIREGSSWLWKPCQILPAEDVSHLLQGHDVGTRRLSHAQPFLRAAASVVSHTAQQPRPVLHMLHALPVVASSLCKLQASIDPPQGNQ